MTTTAVAPAARFLLVKCQHGHVNRVEFGFFGGIDCPTAACNAWAQVRSEIKGRVTAKRCGVKCTSSVSPRCDCSCGGQNHASDHGA